MPLIVAMHCWYVLKPQLVLCVRRRADGSSDESGGEQTKCSFHDHSFRMLSSNVQSATEFRARAQSFTGQ
jgi:hypothetical protein